MKKIGTVFKWLVERSSQAFTPATTHVKETSHQEAEALGLLCESIIKILKG